MTERHGKMWEPSKGAPQRERERERGGDRFETELFRVAPGAHGDGLLPALERLEHGCG